jgi:hypothetical protein
MYKMTIAQYKTYKDINQITPARHYRPISSLEMTSEDKERKKMRDISERKRRSQSFKNEENEELEQYLGSNPNPNPNPNPSIQMKWTSVETHENTTDPDVWGPAFWFSLHNGAVSYPINASTMCAEKMKGFIMGMPYILPCEKCSNDAKTHIESNYYSLDVICSGRTNLFKFFVDMHNVVNKRYGKPIMSIDDAYNLYTGKAVVNKLHYV